MSREQQDMQSFADGTLQHNRPIELYAIKKINRLTALVIGDVSWYLFVCIQFKTIFAVCFIAAVLPLVLLKIFRVHFHG